MPGSPRTARPGTGTMSRAAISFLRRLVVSNSKDHEVAVSRHADTPGTGPYSHTQISYPIHHSRGRKRPRPQAAGSTIQRMAELSTFVELKGSCVKIRHSI